MTPLELLREFLQATHVHWTEHFSPDRKVSSIAVGCLPYTVLFDFDGQQQLVMHGVIEPRALAEPAEPEPPFGGHWPKLPDGFKNQ